MPHPAAPFAGRSTTRLPRRVVGFCLAVVAGLLAPAVLAQDGWEILSTPPRNLPDEALLAPTVEGEALPPVPVTVLAVPVPAEAGNPYVSVVVEIGGSRLLRGTETAELQGLIDVKAVDSAGVERDAFRQSFLLPLDEASRARLEATGLKLFGGLRLPPGQYELRTTVMAGERGARGERVLPLTVPELTGDRQAISPPLVPHGLDRWRAFQQSEGGYPGLGYPFVAPGGSAFMPSASPVVARGSQLEFYLLTFGPGGLEGARARVVGRDGQTVAEAPVQIESREPGARPGEERILARIEALDAPIGRHTLEIVAGGSRASVPIEVVAPAEVASAPEEDMFLETRLVEEEEVAEEMEPIDPREVKVLEERYAAIVSGLGTGRFEESARSLVAFETAVLQSDEQKRIRSLRTMRKAQAEIAQQLVKQSPESLWALIYLHFLVDDVYQEQRATWSVAQNRSFVMELVGMYTNRKSAERTRRGAQLLATLGVPAAALELEPENELALLRIALGREKAGHYQHALPLLEKLVEISPRDPHGRLRLGVNLRRLGDPGRARDLLQAVAGSEGPTWMRLVAYQELADLYMEANRVSHAEAVLRQGIEELEDQSLLLRLSFVLDHQRRRDEAIAVLNRLSTDRTSDEPSARHRYNGQPLEELARARGELLRDAEASLPSLRAAVGGSNPVPTESSR